MQFIQSVRDGIQRHIDKNYGGSLNQFCKSHKIAQAKLWKFLNDFSDHADTAPKSAGMKSVPLGEILDKIGAIITFPDERQDKTRNCVFVKAVKSQSPEGTPEPTAENYKAVPLVDMPVAAGPGLITGTDIRSWVLVYGLHHSVRMKTNLIAVEIGRGQRSMVPTLHPLDIVLVDMDDRVPGPGKGMFLVKEPDGSAMVKRVSTEIRNGKTHFIFYSDNAQEYPPSMYVLEEDYGGHMDNAIVGKVLWAWSDMTQK